MHDRAPKVLVFHEIEWLRVVVCNTFPIKLMIKPFSLNFFSSKASEEICLSGLPLEMEVLPYQFKPDLSTITLSITDHDTND